MNKIIGKRPVLYKVLVFLTFSLFFFSNTLYSLEYPFHKLATASIYQKDSPTREAEIFRDGLIHDQKFMAVAYKIAKYFLSEEMRYGKKDLVSFLKETFQNKPKFLEDQIIDLKSVSEEDGVVHIEFEKNGKKGRAAICKKDKGQTLKSSDKRWQIGRWYAILIEPVDNVAVEHSKDLKGPDAGPAEPVAQRLIQQNGIIEIYIDPETDSMKANRVKWVDNYTPMMTSPELYRGMEVNLSHYYSRSEQEKLERLMRAHPVRGSPVKFRAAIGSGALGWGDGINHSNISHAGMRDGVIYIGNLLLRELLKEENRDLRTEVLENDEFRHLHGLDHDSGDAYQKRLKLVSEKIQPAEELKQAMLEKNVKFLLNEIRAGIKVYGKNNLELFDLFSVLNDVFLSQTKYPIESLYPVKQAISLLDKEEQERLVSILSDKKAEDHRELIIIDDILLMFEDARRIEEWIKVYAPELEGRELWEVSPEIWNESGGLGKVMQYHGVAIFNLIGKSNVKFRQVEPQYRYRMNPDGRPIPLDYEKDITYPLRDLEEVDRFTVTVGDRQVTAVVSRGVNDLGIEVYLIRDEDGNGNSFYTHSLYNYRENPFVPNPQTPTWEEFSIFYCKAYVDFYLRSARAQKKACDERGEKWEAPVIHLNDSQTALVAIYLKMLWIEEIEKAEADPDYEIDPVLEETVVAFTTHTYRNRKEYTLNEGIGDGVMDFMGVPFKYRELLKRLIYHEDGSGEYVYDMASGGVTCSDWQGMVSRAQLDDLASRDEWVNHPEDPHLAWLFRRWEVEVNIVAVTNGDYLEDSGRVFNEEAQELFGEEVDTFNLEPGQIEQVKRKAKEDFRLAPDTVYYSSHGKPEDGQPLLDPDQLVVTYLGRLVDEKAGLDTAFSRGNIEFLLSRGVQVVLFARVQQSDRSKELAGGIIRFIEELKGRGYPGKLIFVPQFSPDEARALKAASDAGVHPSIPETEACGHTESNDNIAAGIVIAPVRTGKHYNKGNGEGIFRAQGTEADINVPGKGNTFTPETMDEAGFRKVYENKLLPVYRNETLKCYQATSLRYGRILDADPTGAGYLRGFSEAVAKKKAKIKARRIARERKKMEEAERSLLNQVFVPDRAKQPEEYAMYEIARRAMNGDTDEAIALFFTSPMIQDLRNNLAVPAGILNKLIGAYPKDKSRKENIRNFVKALVKNIAGLSENDEDSVEAAKAVQIMAGQALIVLSWIERGIPGAENMRIIVDEKGMVRNDKRGKSYVDSDPQKLPSGVKEVKEEGGCGFYWRGIEQIKKLGKAVLRSEFIMFDSERFMNAEGKLVMYLMVHGFIEVPEGLKKATEDGLISAIHETLFINDMLPGSFQTTSTGAGHFQEKELDIEHVLEHIGVFDGKQVTEGWGIQVNVKYDVANGKLRKTDVKLQLVKKGDVCRSNPGYVDYMINLGGLQFNDFSVALSPDRAKEFDPGYDEKKLKEIKEAIAKEGISAPFVAVMFEDGPALVKMDETLDDGICSWEKGPGKEFLRKEGVDSLIDLYKKFSSMDDVYKAVSRLAQAYKESGPLAESPLKLTMTSTEADAKAKKEVKQERYSKTVSMDKTKGMHAFIGDSGDYLSEELGTKKKKDKLLRLPVEWIDLIGADNIKNVIAAIQAPDSHVYIELFTMQPGLEVDQGKYKKYGIEKKSLPISLDKDKRNRANTITIFPIKKGEELSTNRENRRWENLGGMNPDDTIISPVGSRYDKAGVARGIIQGLVLSTIAGDENYTKDSNFVSWAVAQHMALWVSMGNNPEDFDLTGEDLVNIARGDLTSMVNSLNKMIRLMPIMPINMEELRDIMDRLQEVLVRA